MGGMVGAEGFEGSFPSDHYAVFFVRFDCKTAKFQGLARILRRTLLFRIFSPVDEFSQEIGITWYHPIAPKIVQMSKKVGLRALAFHSQTNHRSITRKDVGGASTMVLIENAYEFCRQALVEWFGETAPSESTQAITRSLTPWKIAELKGVYQD